LYRHIESSLSAARAVQSAYSSIAPAEYRFRADKATGFPVIGAKANDARDDHSVDSHVALIQRDLRVVPGIIRPHRSRPTLNRRFALGNTVLIVDDAEFMRVMLRDIVEDMGLMVAGEAGDGNEAVSQYRQLQPDLVLMDITMPNLDGTEAMRRILAEDQQAQVVMITALGQKDQVLDAIKSGARDFIIKPFDQERVQETLNRLVLPCPTG